MNYNYGYHVQLVIAICEYKINSKIQKSAVNPADLFKYFPLQQTFLFKQNHCLLIEKFSPKKMTEY